MRIAKISIENFRGIKKASLLLPKHGVLIGDNNTGKTTILEALDLVFGPDRLNRTPIIDEHDFYQGKYLAAATKSVEEVPAAVDTEGEGADIADAATQEIEELVAPMISIEVVITDLSEEQIATFGNDLEFWDSNLDVLFDQANPSGLDAEQINEALRVTFQGRYDPAEDDFEGATYFTRSLTEGPKPVTFSRKHKQLCGFLYLRTVRTGSRALSLERGSLLDIILRLKEVRPQMWEATLSTLQGVTVADDPALGVSPVLQSINAALKKYVPKEWGIEPHLKVSTLTREHLRKVITAFISSGDGDHAGPFYRQGTGTINMLVLAMLSQIAESKQNVIFAMEEPETAIPPYAQKRIIHEVRKLSSQAIFTSHSPYVLEEFTAEETIVLARDAAGILVQKTINLPANVKLKRYRQEFRTRFCEGLLARRVLIAEGPTEYSAFPVVCRRLAELNSEKYLSLEALGICIVDADGETNIPGMAELYGNIGKRVFAICDKQGDENKALINAQVELLLMHNEKGFEDLVLRGTTEEAVKRFALLLDWPQHLQIKYPNPTECAFEAISAYFTWAKGNWGIADFLAQCSEDEIPLWLRVAAIQLKLVCSTYSPSEVPEEAQAEPNALEEVPLDASN